VRLRAMENDPDPNVRRQVMVAIVAVGPREAEDDTVKPMRDELAKDKRLIADEARLARGEVSIDQLEAGKSVIAMLASEQTMVRRAGAIALGSGNADENTLMHLSEALKDKREKVREAAAFALGQIGPDAASCAPALLEALKDPADKVRKAAFFAIHRIVKK
jgi:HEAT repeat protein